MKKHLFFAALAVAVMTSCSNEDFLATSDVAQTNDGAISFSAYTGSAVATRGTVVAKNSIQNEGIGIFAFYQPATNGVAGSSFTISKYPVPDFMYNQKVEFKNNKWEYSPIKYWPNNTSDKVTFFAYAPYSATKAWEDLNVTTDATGNKISSTFVINNSVSEQTDYLWATPVKDMSKPTDVNADVKFTFSHVTSKVNLYVGVETPDETTGAGESNAGKAWTDANTTIEIKSIKFNNLAQTCTWTKKETETNPSCSGDGSQNITATPYTDADAYTVAKSVIAGTQYYNKGDDNTYSNAVFQSSSTLYTLASDVYTKVTATTAYSTTTTYYSINAPKTSDTDVLSEKTYYIHDETNNTYTKVTNPQKTDISTYYELTATKTAVATSDLKSPFYKKGVNYGSVVADEWAEGWHRFLQCSGTSNIYGTKEGDVEQTTLTTKNDQYMFLAPQTFDDETVTITYTVTTTDANTSLNLNDSKITNTITKQMKNIKGLTNGFEMGKQYNLFFLIGLQTVKVTAEATGWDDTTGSGYVDIPAANGTGE